MLTMYYAVEDSLAWGCDTASMGHQILMFEAV
jgi:hypothetical protein